MTFKKDQSIRLGIDVGSTTVKAVLLNEKKEELFSTYIRHHANRKKRC